MASPSTLCRFELWSSSSDAMTLYNVLLKQLVQPHPAPPKRVELDFDATNILLHGMQAGPTGRAATETTATCRCTCSRGGTCWRRFCSGGSGTRHGGRTPS